MEGSHSQEEEILTPRGIWQCLGTFLVVTIWVGGGASWVEVKDSSKYCVMYRAAPTTKSCPAQSISSAQLEKL